MASGAPQLRVAGNRLLLVDDDQTLARRVSRALTSLRWNVEVVHDGIAALRLLEARKYDALVLDLEMAPIDGWEVLERWRALPDPPPVVVVSGHLDVPTTVRALHAGVGDALQKPLSSDELDESITRAISRKRGLIRDESSARERSGGMLGDSDAMQLLRTQIAQVARYRDLPVLIVGETGSGKELVAREIHACDPSMGPFEAVNCAAIPESLFESEVFGHESGAFTDAREAKAGLLERAQRGTVFFDEISECSESAQARLLHVLETRRFRRLGGAKDLQMQARVVSATNRIPTATSVDGLRSDLYYRVAGVTLVVPPLRERLEDVPLLAEHFLKDLAGRAHAVPRCFSPRALQALQVYDWPGNVRELKAVVEQAAILAEGDVVSAKEVRIAVTERSGADAGARQLVEIDAPNEMASLADNRCGSLPSIERAMIVDAFQSAQGNVSEAARQLGIPRSTLRDKLKRIGLVA